ncbi:MAG: hypothetical protein ABEJ07_02660 [Candidatus Nanohaloarchaea archaeon]
MKLEEPQITYASTKDGVKAVFENHPEIDDILLLEDREKKFLSQVKSLNKERTEAPAFFHKETMISPWKAELEILGELREDGDKLKAPAETVPGTDAEIRPASEEVVEKVESYLNRAEDFELWRYSLSDKAAGRLESELKSRRGYPNRGTVIANGEETGKLGKMIAEIEGEALHCQHNSNCKYSEPLPLEDKEPQKFIIGEDTPITYFGGVGISGRTSYPHLESADKFWVMVTCPGCGYQLSGGTIIGDLAAQAKNEEEEKFWNDLQAELLR